MCGIGRGCGASLILPNPVQLSIIIVLQTRAHFPNIFQIFGKYRFQIYGRYQNMISCGCV